MQLEMLELIPLCFKHSDSSSFFLLQHVYHSALAFPMQIGFSLPSWYGLVLLHARSQYLMMPKLTDFCDSFVDLHFGELGIRVVLSTAGWDVMTKSFTKAKLLG